MSWTDAKVKKLKSLWNDGLTTGEIGKALGMSKNAIVGKAHRLGLKARPSPIKRGDEEAAEVKKSSKSKVKVPEKGKSQAKGKEKETAKAKGQKPAAKGKEAAKEKNKEAPVKGKDVKAKAGQEKEKEKSKTKKAEEKKTPVPVPAPVKASVPAAVAVFAKEKTVSKGGKNGKKCTVLDLGSTSCRWPVGDPKEPDFHFCGREQYPGRPYCEEHCAAAYVQAKNFR